MTAIFQDDEDERAMRHNNPNQFSMPESISDSDILFYVEGDPEINKLNEVSEINLRQSQGFDPMDTYSLQEMKFSKSNKYPITAKDLQKITSNLYSAFNELFKNEGPNPEKPHGSIAKMNGFSLEEIELNLNIEVGVNVIFFGLNTKGSSGLKLVFKRK